MLLTLDKRSYLKSLEVNDARNLMLFLRKSLVSASFHGCSKYIGANLKQSWRILSAISYRSAGASRSALVWPTRCGCASTHPKPWCFARAIPSIPSSSSRKVRWPPAHRSGMAAVLLLMLTVEHHHQASVVCQLLSTRQPQAQCRQLPAHRRTPQPLTAALRRQPSVKWNSLPWAAKNCLVC